MTAFDAHLPPQGDLSAWSKAAAIVGARPGVAIAAVVAAATIVCLSFLALVAGQELRLHTRRAVDSIQASVFLRPQTTRGAAEALKGQLDALPFVRSATLRTKEAAIATLEANGLPQVNRPNPLPDVWLVTLGFGEPGAVAKSLTDQVSGARQSLARLPEVESVDIDAEWLATLGRWQAPLATAFRIAPALLFAVVWLLLGCVFFLAGRAFASVPLRGSHAGSAAIVGALLGLATLATSTTLVAAVAYSAKYADVDWKPIADRVGQMSSTSALALGASAIVLSVGFILATSRR